MSKLERTESSEEREDFSVFPFFRRTFTNMKVSVCANFEHMLMLNAHCQFEHRITSAMHNYIFTRINLTKIKTDVSRRHLTGSFE